MESVIVSDEPNKEIISHIYQGKDNYYLVVLPGASKNKIDVEVLLD